MDTFQCEPFGTVTIRRRHDARSIRIRIKTDGLLVSADYYTSDKQILKLIEQNREAILKEQQSLKSKKKLINEDFRLRNRYFSLSIRRDDAIKRLLFTIKAESSVMPYKFTMRCNSKADLTDEETQEHMLNAINKLIRNVANEPLRERTMQLAKEFGFEVKILDENKIQDLGMNLLYNVGKASVNKPKLIVMRYFGDSSSDEKIGLVGKGLTYDTGGLCLKPADSMLTMKDDMTGGATVIGTMCAVAKNKIKRNVIAVVPACENSINGNSYRPGDIIKSMNGKSVEIINTDAEGRLVLCDALTYVKRFDPEIVIDIATLTGACVIALGAYNAGLMTEDKVLADALLNAANETQDKAWQLPIGEEYNEQLKSNFADLANIGGRWGGASNGGAFLSYFTKDYRWAHLDIAGVAWKEGAEKGATGRPVQLLMQYLLNQVKK